MSPDASVGASAAPFFAMVEPRSRKAPVIVEVPHAGLAIPEAVRSELRVRPDQVARDADIYVDKLYEQAPDQGATMLVALASRYVVDLNRAVDDIDLHTVPDHPSPKGAQPRGVVWRLTTDGEPILRRPLTYSELLRRVAQFHRPYHQALDARLHELRRTFGYVSLIAAHSMPSVGRGLRSEQTTRRPDVVPGTRGGSSADRRLIDLIDAHFRSAGLTVRHDDPYRGGYTTAHYGRPREGLHAVQIELNRALYVDELTGKPRAGDFEALQATLALLVGKVASLRLV